ncbi:MAG TPA: AI-2E family transporter [Arenimonas sp.]|uniref:AI-2E family transporter n=1 Tax=Arenimonas sp. TaxID=1872635 RepID=UPI002C3E4733|nr:AI-2E family transporter [Arenimonas sp.]HMB56856.1 AI-2E family transporter [Arenimonas sp.]
MNETHARRGQWLLITAAVGVLLWLLAPILTPFVLSALLAWLGDPLVVRLERAGRTRTVAVLLVFVLMVLVITLALVILVPLLEDQVGQFIVWLPRLADWITVTAIPWVEHRGGFKLATYIDPTQLIALLKGHWQQAGGIAATVIGGLSKSGLAIIEFFANIALIPVVTFYFLRDWRSMLTQIRELLPRPLEPVVVRLAAESDEVLGGFLRGQLSVMLSLGTIYATGLWLVGLDLGLLIGFVAGLVSFVPYLGAIVGVSAAVIATLVQHGDVTHLALVLMVFAIGQTMEGFVLVPWMVGDKIGLHPVAVIFAIMTGGQLFGFLGVLLALPVAAVAMVGLRYAHDRYTHSHLYGGEKERAGVDLALVPAPEDLEILPAEPAADAATPEA